MNDLMVQFPVKDSHCVRKYIDRHTFWRGVLQIKNTCNCCNIYS